MIGALVAGPVIEVMPIPKVSRQLFLRTGELGFRPSFTIASGLAWER